MKDFSEQIISFNQLYKLPVAALPSIMYMADNEFDKNPEASTDTKELTCIRLKGFKKTLLDEITEVDDILLSIKVGIRCKDGAIIVPQQDYTPIEFLVDMADWLGDIQVYCASEMAKFGLPLNEVLAIIMSSNFSKMGANGLPMYDENGKVLKGPGYWKPEPRIKQLLQQKIEEAFAADAPVAPAGINWR